MLHARIQHVVWMLAIQLAFGPSFAAARDFYVYFGTQSTAPGTGFSLAHFDSDTGVLTKPTLIEVADAPSFFVIDPDGRHLYSTNFSGVGGVSAYSIEPATGKLTLINRVPGGNAGTSFIGLDQSGRFALSANLDTGHIAVFRLNPDGGLGERTAWEIHTGSSVNPKRQSRSYPHSIFVDPTNRFALAPDLGLDKMFEYRFDAEAGTLVAADPAFVTVKPGSGPRHVRFHPNGKWVYLLCEMGSVVYQYDWDSSTGKLTEKQSISTLPDGFTGENNAAEIEISPNGKFVYASNRGDDSIAIFAIDPASGKLSPIGRVPTQGKNPRNFAFDPTGQWMLCTNQAGDDAVVFRIDARSGALTQAGKPVGIIAPCCERFLAVPDGVAGK